MIRLSGSRPLLDLSGKFRRLAETGSVSARFG